MKIHEVTVSGDIGDYVFGNVLTTPAQIAAYYRRCINEDPPGGQPIDMTDERIFEIIEAVDVSDCTEPSDIDVMRCDAIEKAITGKTAANTNNQAGATVE